MKFTDNYLDQILAVSKAIKETDAIVVGAGAGLSTAAGFTYDGERFETWFSDFQAKYGFDDMYTGGFYPYDSLEEHWAYWSRYIDINRYQDAPESVYENLYELLHKKDYFVITTNVDHCFQKAGFDRNRLFDTQGDYGLFQCSEPCCQETYDNKDIIQEMLRQQKDMRIPSALLPVCPHCGRAMTMNLRSDDRFVEDEGWHQAAKRYHRFLKEKDGKPILFLELGVGYNTPVIIKYPFWQMTQQNKKAIYVCVNLTDARCPTEIKNQSICIMQDIKKVLQDIKETDE